MTPNEVKLRCTEEGDCWLWDGSASNGYPTVKRQRKNVYVRTLMFESMGKHKPDGHNITSRCGCKLCVNPEHLYVATVSAINRKAARAGAWSSPARAAKISASRRKNSVLTMDIARTIRLSDESGPVLSLRYGIDKSMVNNIKRGDAWKDYASPWAGL